MKSVVVTDIELRSRWYANRRDKLAVPEGAILTPAAKDFIRENNIDLVYGAEASERGFTVDPIPRENGRNVFIDAITGEKLYDKRENYTHLRGNLLVPKTHPQIRFRGRLDSLMAEIIQAQTVSNTEGGQELVKDLEELLRFTRKILTAEVNDSPFGEFTLLGMNSSQLRHASQNVRETFGFDHPVPSYQHGAVCAALNRLRTCIRETELAAADAFPDSRIDIIEALNRLSSAAYILYCRKLSGYYGETKR
jgi:ethanolamine utilization cobalamin adenosyltransferase